MLGMVLLVNLLSTEPVTDHHQDEYFSSEVGCNYQVAHGGREEVPSIFKESGCMGSVKLPPKPTAIPSYAETNFDDLPLPPPFSCSFGTNSIPVSSCANLISAYASASCGTDIVLESGTYSCDLLMQKTCPTNNPITIRAKTALGAIVTGKFNMFGSGNQVANVYFRGNNAGVRVGGINNKVIGNRFQDWSSAAAIFLTSGNSAEIAYNEITEPAPWSVGPLSEYPVRMGLRSGYLPGNLYGNGFHSSAWIHHNYFANFPDKPGLAYSSGQDDAMEICANQVDLRSNFLIEYNLVENHLEHGAGIVDVKCASGTVVRYNTILNASNGGRLDFRNGDGGAVIGNYLENTGGINIAGTHHLVKDNVVVGGGIIGTMTGTASTGNPIPGGAEPGSFNTLTCNKGPMHIGIYGHPFPSANNTVINNTPSNVLLMGEQNTTVKTDSTVCTPPHKLSSAEVGLTALAVKCN